MPDSTNLTQKIDELQEQLTTQDVALHEVLDGITTRLDDIITLLGGTPPAPTATLQDVVDAIAITNTNTLAIATAIGALRDDATAQTDAAALQRIDTIALLDSVLGTLDVMNTNNAANALALQTAIDTILVNSEYLLLNSSYNAQNILSAILSTDFCCTETPLLEPPLVEDIITIDEDHCKRVQAVIALFGAWVEGISTFGAAGNAIAGVSITGLLAGSAVAAGAAPPAIPAIVIGAVVGILAIISAAVMATLKSEWNTEPLKAQLRDFLYCAADAEAADTTFSTIIDASDVLSAVWKPLLKAMWYSYFINLIYDDTQDLELTGFSGTACAECPTEDECWTTTAELYTWSGGGPGYAVNWEGNPFGITYTNVNGATWSIPIFTFEFDLTGYYYRVNPACYANIVGAGGYAVVAAADTWYLISGSTTYLTHFYLSGPFVFELCNHDPTA